MSDDIVKEIRESRIALHSTAHKAADEIEKMREELDACDEKTKKLCDEITRLRADLAAADNMLVKRIQQVAAVIADRDRMRDAVQLLINTQEEWERSVEKIIGKQPNVFLRAIDSARAALEGSGE